MSVYFPHSGYADHREEKIYRSIEKHTKTKAKNMKIFGEDLPSWDEVMEWSVSVLDRTHSTRETTEEIG